ncbi:MAG: stage II sporulation protein M, partial [Candidatus Bathyarchaeia archaeon]
MNISYERERFHQNVKIPFLIVTVIFLLSCLLGYLNGYTFIWMIELLKEIFGEELGTVSPLYLFGFIFINNTIKSFLVIPFGTLLAIPPLLFIFSNGFLIGILSYSLVQTHQMGLEFLLAGTLPHGIIELTAVFWSSAIGLRVGWVTISKLRGLEISNIKIEMISGFRTF